MSKYTDAASKMRYWAHCYAELAFKDDLLEAAALLREAAERHENYKKHYAEFDEAADENDELKARISELNAALQEIADGRWNVGQERSVSVREFARMKLREGE